MGKDETMPTRNALVAVGLGIAFSAVVEFSIFGLLYLIPIDKQVLPDGSVQVWQGWPRLLLLTFSASLMALCLLALLVFRKRLPRWSPIAVGIGICAFNGLLLVGMFLFIEAQRGVVNLAAHKMTIAGSPWGGEKLPMQFAYSDIGSLGTRKVGHWEKSWSPIALVFGLFLGGHAGSVWREDTEHIIKLKSGEEVALDPAKVGTDQWDEISAAAAKAGIKIEPVEWVSDRQNTAMRDADALIATALKVDAWVGAKTANEVMRFGASQWSAMPPEDKQSFAAYALKPDKLSSKSRDDLMACLDREAAKPPDGATVKTMLETCKP